MFATTRPALSSEALHGGVQLVTLDGEFDISHTPQIGYRLSDILGACEGHIVVDLRGVSFLDSRMVGTLVSAFKKAEHRGCRLALVLVSLLFSTQLTFALAPVYIGAMTLTVIAVWQITGDGEASVFEGLALIGIYVIVATVALYE